MFDPPDEYFTALGKIASRVSMLEFGIMFEISRICCLKFSRTLVFMGGEDYGVLVAKLSKLAHSLVKDAALLERFDQLNGDLVSIGTRRNEYLHSNWHLESGNSVSRSRYRKQMKNGSQMEFKEGVPIDDLSKLFADIKLAEDTLQDLTEETIRVLNIPTFEP